MRMATFWTTCGFSVCAKPRLWRVFSGSKTGAASAKASISSIQPGQLVFFRLVGHWCFVADIDCLIHLRTIYIYICNLSGWAWSCYWCRVCCLVQTSSNPSFRKWMQLSMTQKGVWEHVNDQIQRGWTTGILNCAFDQIKQSYLSEDVNLYACVSESPKVCIFWTECIWSMAHRLHFLNSFSLAARFFLSLATHQRPISPWLHPVFVFWNDSWASYSFPTLPSGNGRLLFLYSESCLSSHVLPLTPRSSPHSFPQASSSSLYSPLLDSPPRNSDFQGLWCTGKSSQCMFYHLAPSDQVRKLYWWAKEMQFNCLPVPKKS